MTVGGHRTRAPQIGAGATPSRHKLIQAWLDTTLSTELDATVKAFSYFCKANGYEHTPTQSPAEMLTMIAAFEEECRRVVSQWDDAGPEMQRLTDDISGLTWSIVDNRGLLTVRTVRPPGD